MKKQSITLFLSGMAMGTIDIVPGVSGSTVAVLLGIYERFINALKNIDARLFKALLALFRDRFSAESRNGFKQAAREADLPWLLTLLAGLATAFVIASIVIPMLMERHPQIMRGIFFGLVLGSIATPIRDTKSWNLRSFVIIAAFAAGFYFLLGQQFSPPVRLEAVAAHGDTLQAVCARTPCFNTPAEILGLPQNGAISGVAPDTALPDGTVVTVTKPYALYCVFAGFVAICAMLLPGISGSFMLLVLGCYYFMLNTAKGFLSGLAHGSFHGTHLLYIACFAGGALAGIALFSRALTWLLEHYRDITLAAIIGILLGCLRAIWPYRSPNPDGSWLNIIPAASDALFWPTAAAIACGLAVVAVTIAVQAKMDKKNQQPDG